LGDSVADGDNIKTDRKEILREDIDWIKFAQASRDFLYSFSNIQL